MTYNGIKIENAKEGKFSPWLKSEKKYFSEFLLIPETFPGSQKGVNYLLLLLDEKKFFAFYDSIDF